MYWITLYYSFSCVFWLFSRPSDFCPPEKISWSDTVDKSRSICVHLLNHSVEPGRFGVVGPTHNPDREIVWPRGRFFAPPSWPHFSMIAQSDWKDFWGWQILIFQPKWRLDIRNSYEPMDPEAPDHPFDLWVPLNKWLLQKWYHFFKAIIIQNCILQHMTYLFLFRKFDFQQRCSIARLTYSDSDQRKRLISYFWSTRLTHSHDQKMFATQLAPWSLLWPSASLMSL